MTIPVIAFGVQGPPGPTVASITNATALAALATTGFPQGAQAFLQSLKAYFKYDPTSGATPDGVVFIAAQGGGNWVRSSSAPTDLSAVSWSQAGTIGVPTSQWMWNLQPTDPQWAPFGTWISGHLWNSVWDTIHCLGYNPQVSTGDGGLSTEPCLVWSVESTYTMEPGRPVIETYVEWDSSPATQGTLWRVRPFYVYLDKVTGWSSTKLQLGYGPSSFQITDTASAAIFSAISAGIKVVGTAGTPSSIVNGDTLMLSFTNEIGTVVSTTVTFTGTATIFTVIAQQINAALGASPAATVENGVLCLTSHANCSITNTLAQVAVVGGTAVAKCGLTVGTTTPTASASWSTFSAQVSTDWGSPAAAAPITTANSPGNVGQGALDYLAQQVRLLTQQVQVLQANQFTDASVQARFRADMGLSGVVNDGDKASAWNDTRLGSSVSASQATGSKQPVWHKNGGPNNRSYLHFTKANATSLVTGAIAGLTQPCFILVVARPSAWTGTAVGTLVDGVVGNHARIYNTFQNEIDAYAGVGGLSGATYSGVQNQWMTFAAYFNGASSVLYYNAVQKIAANAGANTALGLTIGDFGGGGDPFDGDLAEVIALSGTPTSQYLAQLNLYLLSYYNLTGIVVAP